MTNTALLRELIRESGLKVTYIAAQLDISRSALNKKINNISAFNQYEIEKLCNLLRITSLKLKEAVFFASNVD